MPGPVPRRQVRRSNPRPEWRSLPSAGRSGPPPKWPLARPPKGLADLWKALWATPQSVVWEESGWTRVVARYATVLMVCESPLVTAAMLAEARQMEDRLGLSPMAMRRLQWEVAKDSSAHGAPAEVTSLADYRDL